MLIMRQTRLLHPSPCRWLGPGGGVHWNKRQRAQPINTVVSGTALHQCQPALPALSTTAPIVLREAARGYFFFFEVSLHICSHWYPTYYLHKKEGYIIINIVLQTANEDQIANNLPVG